MYSGDKLKEFIRTCKRKALEALLNAAELPTEGLKGDLVTRLEAYIDVGPSKEFLAHVNLIMQSTMPRYGVHTGVPIPDIGSSAQPSVTSGNPQAVLRPHPGVRFPQYRETAHQQFPKVAHMAPPIIPPQLNNWNIQPSDLSRSYNRQGTGSVSLPTTDGVVRVPFFPDLRFSDTPFYEILDVIQRPTLIVPPDVNFHTGKRPYERTYDFKLDSNQSETIAYHSCNVGNRREFRVQALVRFGKLEPSMLHRITASQPSLEPFQDNMPIHLAVQVNQRNVILPPFLPTSRPNMDGRRNARPISITSQLRMCPGAVNLIKLSWSHDYASFTYYFFAIYLVKKLSTKNLCDFLKMNCYRPANFIRKQIIAKLASSGLSLNDGEEEDDDIQIQNTLPVQLLCPLSKCRINLPVRGKRCQHIQCYDADTYFIINERKPAWKCPVCDLLAPFDELFVDGLLMEILDSKESQTAEEIVFNEDGSWVVMKSSDCGGANGNVESSRGSSPLSTSNGDGQSANKSSSVSNPSTAACASVGGSTDVLIDLTASDDDDGGGPQPPKRPAIGEQSLSCSAPSRQHSSSSTYRVSHPPLSAPSQHESLSNQFLPQHRQCRPVPCVGNSMLCAHSNSVPSTSAMSNPALLVDAKPDTRRVFLSSLAPPIPSSRPCSHSATPSPRTPQSLGHASSTVAKSSLPISQTVSSSSNHHNIPIPLNLNTKELMAKMATAASFSPRILEDYMRLPEYNQFSVNSVPQPPPKAAHQNNGNSNNNNISQGRFANFIPPFPAHSNLPLQNTHQWRTQGPSTLSTAPSNTVIVSNSSTANPSFLFPNVGSGGVGGRVPQTCSSSSSPTFLDFWSSAAAHMTSAHPMMRQSLGDFYRSTLPPSPPHAHSSNSTPPPPPKGDPRHIESGGGLYSSPSDWSTNQQ
ncbi:unnamed protein product [Rodentolepis nana]|uniref:E3 SUMO-protein ligase gei-17 n=1 Tax=Rodentolepis nana TaxID=102285 RepID=A0A0R3T5D8_RODNA|nr:unnamed protein product [Rodentolepis nana]